MQFWVLCIFFNSKAAIVGYIYAYKYVNKFDLLTQKPNHSTLIKDENLDINLGKCRLLTLDCDNGTAASGISGTHNEYYAEVSFEGKAIYMLTFNKNDKDNSTKNQFVEILKGLKVI